MVPIEVRYSRSKSVLKSVLKIDYKIKPKINPKLVLGNDTERIILLNGLENFPPLIIKARVVHCACVISDTCPVTTDTTTIPTATSYNYRLQQLR